MAISGLCDEKCMKYRQNRGGQKFCVTLYVVGSGTAVCMSDTVCPKIRVTVVTVLSANILQTAP